jgi:hypothetical protein
VPRIEAVAVVDLPATEAFALSQTYGEIRYRWDPFVREQHLLDGATRAGKGVRTSTTSRHGLAMVSEYVTFRPPTHVGMRMVKGPRFFDSFSGGWHFTERDDGTTEATWRYNFTCRPSWIRPVADPIGQWLLGRDIRRRIEAFRKACTDPSIMTAVRATLAEADGGTAPDVSDPPTDPVVEPEPTAEA